MANAQPMPTQCELAIDGLNQVPEERLPLKSMIDRFVNANWNGNNASASDSNMTTNLPPIETHERLDDGCSSALDANSSTVNMREIYDVGNPGTILFADSCGSTSGWIARATWGGDPLMSQIQTGISLLVNNDRLLSGSIPPLGVYSHGPMWIKNLTNPASLGEGLNLAVDLEHVYAYGKMGDVGVAVYDFNGEVIFKTWIHDAWYGSRSDAYVGYCLAGPDSAVESVEKSGSWSGTLRVWYDKEYDLVKASCPGGTFTLASNPSELELNRYAKTIAIYYAGIQTRNYESKFIESIHLSVVTNPDTAFEAYPLTPAMDGHWFPQARYSRLYFQVNQPYPDAIFNLRIAIVVDQDEYDRTLTIKVDGIVYYSDVIYDEAGFDGIIPILGFGTRNVEIQINWGAYVPKGWKLVHFYPERMNGEPLEVVGEYFPQASIAQLAYLAQLGSNSRINLELEAAGDSIPRTTRVYVDGVFKHEATGDHAWEWYLGEYPEGSVHEITVELQYGGYVEWGKKLTINRISHFRGAVEVDYMPGHSPSQDDLDVLEAYYLLLGYERAEFYLDDEVPFVEVLDLSTDGIWPSQQYWQYSNDYRDHIGDPKWEWILCLHYYSWCGVISLGVNGYHWGNYGIIIQDQVMKDHVWLLPLTPSRRTVMLHEYGHHINIFDLQPSGIEEYCTNPQCAMSTLNPLCALSYPFYCAHHWSQHRWPGW